MRRAWYVISRIILLVHSELLPCIAKHWDAHQISKQHKTSLQRIRQEEVAAAAAARKKEGKKRQAVEDVPMTGPSVEEVSEEADRGTKRVRTEDTAGPVDVPPTDNTVDAELDSFLSSLSAIPSEAPAEITSAPTITTNKSKYKPSQPETQTFYESAAITLAPAAAKGSTISSGATAASNPFAGRLVRNVDIGPELPADDAEEEEEETEAERRAREQREEREEIMGRLEDEQRAQ